MAETLELFPNSEKAEYKFNTESQAMKFAKVFVFLFLLLVLAIGILMIAMPNPFSVPRGFPQ
jgi:hypothetical protein